MAEVRYTERFWADFDIIIRRLAVVAGRPVAINYDAEFRRSVGQLVNNPGIGAPRRKYGARTRMLIVSPYLIFYEGGPKAKAVSLLRILHGSRRITRRMLAASRDDDPGQT